MSHVDGTEMLLSSTTQRPPVIRGGPANRGHPAVAPADRCHGASRAARRAAHITHYIIAQRGL